MTTSGSVTWSGPVQIPSDGAALAGDLVLAQPAQGVVLFAQGSGTSRFSPRTRYLAGALRGGGLGTLLCDLLTPAEDERDRVTRELRFNVELLADRLLAAIDWLVREVPEARGAVGCFGSGTGAAAALLAAVERPQHVAALVARSGRLDLAGAALEDVRVPTLLLVGGADGPGLDLNQRAFSRLHCEKRLSVVPGATKGFEDAAALEEAAIRARRWFEHHLGAGERERQVAGQRAAGT